MGRRWHSAVNDFEAATDASPFLAQAPSALAGVRLIAVGSRNPVKLAAARAVMEQVCPGVEIAAVEVESGVRSQPLSDDEMISGAATRALGARSMLDADLGVGLEGGVHHSQWGVLLTGWAAVVDRQGRIGLGSGGRITLPPALAQAVENGEEVGPAMDRLSGLSDTRRGPGAVGVLTNGIVVRDESFRVAIAYALARFIHPAWYPD